MTSKTHHEIVTTIAAGVQELVDDLTAKLGLSYGIAEIMIAEYVLYAMRSVAPMELDEYLDVITEEMRSFEHVNDERVNAVRYQLSETMDLVCT